MPPGGSRDNGRIWLPWLGSFIRMTCGSCAARSLPVIDVRIDGWDIRGRWFSVVIRATPRRGELRRGETIPWRVVAAQIAPREHRGSR